MLKRTLLSTLVFSLVLAATALQAEPASVSLFRRGILLAAGLDDGALASQVILAGLGREHEMTPDLKAFLERFRPGGIMLFHYNLEAEKEQVRRFTGELCAAAEVRGIPPFIAVDHEGGYVHRFGEGVRRLPSAESYWRFAERLGPAAALQALAADSLSSAREIRSLGITLNMAPVAEILNDENQAFLDTRSYGPESAFVEAAAGAFVRSMEAAGVACVLKHFPGNSAADPHGEAGTLSGDSAALEAMTRPFRNLIRRMQVSGVMVSHAAVPAWDQSLNASLSEVVIREKLRGELGFEGMVICDDFSMGAVAGRGLRPEEAAVEAIKAGADVVMAWPRTINAVHRGILAALRDGGLSRQRLLEAAGRVIAEKLRFGLCPQGNQ